MGLPRGRAGRRLPGSIETEDQRRHDNDVLRGAPADPIVGPLTERAARETEIDILNNRYTLAEVSHRTRGFRDEEIDRLGAPVCAPGVVKVPSSNEADDWVGQSLEHGPLPTRINLRLRRPEACREFRVGQGVRRSRRSLTRSCRRMPGRAAWRSDPRRGRRTAPRRTLWLSVDRADLSTCGRQGGRVGNGKIAARMTTIRALLVRAVCALIYEALILPRTVVGLHGGREPWRCLLGRQGPRGSTSVRLDPRGDVAGSRSIGHPAEAPSSAFPADRCRQHHLARGPRHDSRARPTGGAYKYPAAVSP